MEITLSPETIAMIREKVDSGRYPSADDVVEAAIGLLDERDRFEYLRGLIQEAEQDFREGKLVEWTPELHRQWFRDAEERVRQGFPLDPDVCP